MKNSLLPLIIFSLALLPACHHPEPESPDGAKRFAEIAVSLGQADGEDETRSMVDIDVENFQKAALFAFDPETGLLLTREDAGSGVQPVVAFPLQKSFNWVLPLEVRMDIYAIVNYGDLDLGSLAREGLRKSDLEALRFTSRSPSELKQLETAGYGMPMAGIRKGVRLENSGQGLEVAVKKLYAKYNLYFDLSRIENEDWHVQAMHMIVENANSEVPYFVEGFRQDDPDKLVEYDRATEKDLDEIQQGGNGHTVTLYMLENCQGIREGAESWKTVYKDLGFQAVRNCTYIDLSVKIRRQSGEFQNLGFAIYLGETDMRSNFDIRRNLLKTVRIVLPGPDDPNPASTFFKFSGTDTPTVMPGGSLDLYYVTNLAEEDIRVSCSPEGHLTPGKTVYQADEDGIATGYIRLQAAEGIRQGETCLVTGGSEERGATDQRTVTADWPAVLEVDLSNAPAYVAQAGYLSVTPAGGIVRVDAEVKPGSEGILEVREVGVSGSLMNIGLAGLSAGTGTVILHHYGASGVETGSQEVDITVLAPLLRFGMDTYRLTPDGKTAQGTLAYMRADGSSFTGTELARFDQALIRKLLFPTTILDVIGCGSYVDASFVRDADDDRRRLTIPVQFQVKRLYAGGREIPWEDEPVIGQVSYCGAPSANIPSAEADLAMVNPLAGLAGTCLGVIENNLPVYEALLAEPYYLEALGIQASLALNFKTYRDGSTFSVQDSQPSLELDLPVSIDLPVALSGPEEFSFRCEGRKLRVSASLHPETYSGFGRQTLYAQVIHTETGEKTSPVEMGYLEIYLIGAVGPFLRGDVPYEAGGMIVPEGGRSPIAALASGIIRIQENVAETSLPGYYLSDSGAGYNLYHQAVEIDDNGIDRYAYRGETSYLNAYRIRTGSFAPGVPVMEFRFGSIFQGHGCGINTAALECDRMLEASFLEGSPTGKLWHLPGAGAKDGMGLSYCALANLFGGNSGPVYDIFLEVRE